MNLLTGVKLISTWTTRYGWAGIKDLFYPIYYTGLRPFERMTDPGTNIYELDWDLLIVFDACRVDLLTSTWGGLEDESVDSYRSVASMTRDWMARTFTPTHSSEMAETAYICGNPFSRNQLDPDDFAYFDAVWRDAWMDPGTVPPRAVTDRVIDLLRREQPQRTIAHYLQPHCPFIDYPHLSDGKEVDRFGSSHWPDVWERYRMGQIPLEELWEGYRANLEHALQELDLLLSNVNADDVILTSDHGNGVGEAGIYGHPPGQWIDAVREVPLVRLSAIDSGDYTPTHDYASVPADIGDQLRSLGYR